MKLGPEHGRSRKSWYQSTKLHAVTTKMTIAVNMKTAFIFTATGASDFTNVLRTQTTSKSGRHLCNLLRVLDSPIRQRRQVYVCGAY